MKIYKENIGPMIPCVLGTQTDFTTTYLDEYVPAHLIDN